MGDAKASASGASGQARADTQQQQQQHTTEESREQQQHLKPMSTVDRLYGYGIRTTNAFFHKKGVSDVKSTR